MKLKKFFALTLLVLMTFASSAHALSLGDLISSKVNEGLDALLSATPEDALSQRSDDSVYFVIKLDDTAKFLKWLLSRENINVFMPLILGSKESNEIIGGLEIISAIVENTPLKSAALTVGINKSEIKLGLPFVQMAFTVDSSVSSIVKKIANGEASAVDIAKLLLGTKSPLASLAETMIKVEKADDNILKIDNEVFLKAQDDLILLGTSLNEVKAAIGALNDAKSRMFGNIKRRFDKKDFAFLHVDPDTLTKLDPDKDLDDLKLSEYFGKPLEVEFAFERLKDKFSISTGVNLLNSLKKKYASKISANKLKPVKGGNIDLNNAGGNKSPLLAFGSYFDFSALKEQDELKTLVKSTLRQLKNRFGITEDEVSGLMNGPLSLVINGNVEIEGFKVPALYFSQTGKKGAAAKIYNRLVKSPHFQNVQEGILQVDSSLSPVSCLVENRAETLDIAFAELASLADKPEVTSALGDLLNKSAISAFWFDFAGLQAWLNDDENGVFAMAAPVAKIMGYGKYIDALREVLNAKLSVPSVSLWAENSETFYTDFAIAEINAEEGLMSKLVKIYRDFSK
ncbi:MAG: hypothetical protein IJU48_00850 [Synergistaceae bacterium]|nr:hypothetical protein [Synergistaceae bacterium]